MEFIIAIPARLCYNVAVSMEHCTLHTTVSLFFNHGKESIL